MKEFDIKKIIDWLGYILKCPICSNKYNLEKTRVLESEQNEVFNEARILIHSDCAKCKSSVMFNVEIKGPEVFSVGMVTDLTGNDSSKFKNLEPIGANEILGIHQALKNFKGDFVSSLRINNFTYMVEVTLKAIEKLLDAKLDQKLDEKLEPINTRLAAIEGTLDEHTTKLEAIQEIVSNHSNQIDSVAKDVKTLIDEKIIGNGRLERLESWGSRVGTKTQIKLEL